MSDAHRQWRNEGCPCGRGDCEFYEYDHEAQNCYGQDGAGDPAVVSCRGYVPDPSFVAAWAVREDREKDNPALAELLHRLTQAETERDALKERVRELKRNIGLCSGPCGRTLSYPIQPLMEDDDEQP